MPNLSIVNFEKGSLKPIASVANKLIDKISNTVGYFFMVEKGVKLAQIEATKKTINEISEDPHYSYIQRLAIISSLSKNVKEYVNSNNILALASHDLKSDNNPKNMDDDWISYFFDKAKNISDSEMQLIWGKILAKEANNPTSISKSLVNSLSLIEKYQAETFQNLCQYQIEIIEPSKQASSKCLIIPFDIGGTYFEHINRSILSELDNIGLISYTDMGSKYLTNTPILKGSYFGKNFVITCSQPALPQIYIGSVNFTLNGMILSNSTVVNQLDNFFDILKIHCQKYNYKLSFLE